MRTVYCRSQFSFPDGMLMCTTSCVQVGMAALCDQIRVWDKNDDAPGCNGRMGSSGHARLGSAGGGSLEDALNWCMDVASLVHGRVETILDADEARQAGRQKEGGRNGEKDRHHHHHHRRGRHMISVNKLVRTLDINMKGLGVCMEELVVCGKGFDTQLKVRGSPSEKESSATSWLKYEASSCYVTMWHIPACMVVESSSSISSRDPRCLCTGTATANGHTVCMMWCSNGEYAFFDPAPGRMCTGLTAQELVDMVRSSLGLPEPICSDPSLHSTRVRMMARRGMGGGAAGDDDDGLGVGRFNDMFYCDVTLFFLEKRA